MNSLLGRNGFYPISAHFMASSINKPASTFQYIYKMKVNKSHNTGSGIAIGSAIGVALGFAFGKNSSNSSQYIALGLAIGIAAGSVIDFMNRKK